MRNQSSTITNSRAGPSYARHDGKESHGSREADKAIEQAGKRSYYVRIANPRVLGELAWHKSYEAVSWEGFGGPNGSASLSAVIPGAAQRSSHRRLAGSRPTACSRLLIKSCT
jgi:hypothetical protein